MEAMLLPDDFKCPISLEIMSDPVILTSGQTFDRATIQRWLDSGNRTCPVTKLPLPPDPPLIPNHALRNLISNFAPTTSAPYPPLSLRQTLVSNFSFPSNFQTLTQIRQASKKDADFRRYLFESGAVSILLRHVGTESGTHPELQELALRILLDVSLDGDDVKVGLVVDGAVGRIVSAIVNATTSSSSRALAATTLTSLAMADVNKFTIGAHPSAITGLVAVLMEGRGRERSEAATALYVLCSFPENRRRTVRIGAVPVLVELAISGLERAVEVLGQLGKCREGRDAMKATGVVSAMATVLRKGKPRSVEHALLVINLVCDDDDGEEMQIQVWKEGVLDATMGLLGEDQNGGNIGKNAARLVDTLQRKGFESLLM